MAVAIVTPPEPIVTLDEAKRFMRVTGSGDDDLIEMLVATISAEIEPPDSWIGRAFGVQTLEARFDGCHLWPKADIVLPCPPLRQVSSFTYLDPEGAEQVLADGDFVVTNLGPRAVLLPAYGRTWPTARRVPDAVRIVFEAGYDADDPQLKPAKMAVILMAQELQGMSRADLFVRRETTEGVGSTEWSLSSQAAATANSAAQRLLARYRVWGA